MRRKQLASRLPPLLVMDNPSRWLAPLWLPLMIAALFTDFPWAEQT